MPCTAVIVSPAPGTVVTAGGTTYGQTATYGCSASYELVGNPTRTCGADGAWTWSVPAAPAALAFVTSRTGNGNLSSWGFGDGLPGVEGGDEICQGLAAEAHLPAPESFGRYRTFCGT